MRILVGNHHRTLVGGVETYLGAVIEALQNAGHQLAFAHEAASGPGDILIPLPPNVPSFEAGAARERLPSWKPDVVYLHAMHDLAFTKWMMSLAPSVAFAHGYYGLCISGMKMWKRAPAHACAKQFDWKCLFYFHAKRCGGMNPIRMLQDFFRESRKLELLRQSDAVLTHGGRMRDEYIAQGLAPDRVHALPHFVPPGSSIDVPWRPADAIRLVFVGRFDEIKGGQLLLRALPELSARAQRAVTLQMIGSGPSAPVWKKLAREIASEKIRVQFRGWLESAGKDALIAESDLLIVPSVWPEPFGQVGLEAGALGVPAVAFDVGGIPNWLRHGVNGILAPANPPTTEGLVAAILIALGNAGDYAKLRANAKQIASEFTVDRHVRALEAVFESVVKHEK